MIRLSGAQRKTLEEMIGDMVRSAIATPGWTEEIDVFVDYARERLSERLRPADTADVCAAYVMSEVEDILREIKEDPTLLVTKYAELMSDTVTDTMCREGIKMMREAGADVREFKDETGETYIRISNPDVLGFTEEDVEMAQSIGPAPVGALRPVQ